MTVSAPSFNNTQQDTRQNAPVALTVTNLSAGYPGQRHVVDDVTFDVRCGERIAIIGPNGAGKSTLFKALVGLIPHPTGEISIHGESCRTSHRMMGYVPQDEDIDWRFPVTVQDVVMMGRVRKIGWLRWPGLDDYDVVEAVLDQVGMLAFKQRQIGELSGGQRRRVFIARALAQETDVLLLDEPFSGVDVAAEREIMETLDQLQADDITVLLATHDLNLASTRFDRLLLLNQWVVAYGQPESIFTPENLQKAYGGRIGVFHRDDHVVIVADEHGCP